jgi:hypothetical protein
MAGIGSADPNHLQTIELDYLRSYSTQDFATVGTYLGVNGVYTYYDTYDYILAAYNDSHVMPVILLEASYEFENNPNTDGGSLGNLRKQEYWTFLAGGVGHLYGSRYTWTSYWATMGNLDSPGANQISYLSALLTPRKWWLLVPDQNHSVVTAGYGTYRGNSTDIHNSTYVTTARASDGSLIISYCPVSTTLTVDMTKLSGAATAHWYDPTNGTFTAISGSPFANTGTQNFTTPGNNSSGDPDWVLVVEVVGDLMPPDTTITITNGHSFPSGQVGIEYNAPLEVTGGRSPYSISVTSGTLPGGLSLVGQNIVGAPTQAGKKTFTIKVTDQLGLSVSRKYSLSISKALTLSTSTLRIGKASRSYSVTLKAVNGSKPYNWSIASGTLPAGLVFNTSTGKISGIPLSTGSVVLTFQVGDSLGGKAQKTLSLTIN